ncbi:MAG TPA: hypothetical protein VFQ95_00515 [Rhodanobacteraceae bacterium]|nr:hypothetical protein [Rhodanobacteraceae bacterium]
MPTRIGGIESQRRRQAIGSIRDFDDDPMRVLRAHASATPIGKQGTHHALRALERARRATRA